MTGQGLTCTENIACKPVTNIHYLLRRHSKILDFEHTGGLYMVILKDAY